MRKANTRERRRKTKKITIEELVKRRRALGDKKGDCSLDRSIVSSIADEILESDELCKQIYEKPYLLIEACFTIVDKKGARFPSF